MKSFFRWIPFLVAMGTASQLLADEGMWPFNNVPESLKQRYGWAPDQKWLDHVRLASVRFNNGGSGSFVSSTGLVLTNHHVGSDCIQKISTADHDYVTTGYLAKAASEEVKCPDLELDVLEGVRDVTVEVNAVVKPDQSPAQILEAQKGEQAKLEKECHEKTGLRCETVTLYEGGEYDLYRYRKYTDVRLVAAPEKQIAFFGGDPDNFTYPRWDIDFALFRIYENGQPVRPEHFLKWNSAGAREGELVLVSGNPGSTSRLETLAQLEFQRDAFYPSLVDWLERRAKLVHDFSEKSTENARIGAGFLFSVENALKAARGRLEALRNPNLMSKKANEERDLRAAVEARPELTGSARAWDAIASAEKAYAARYQRELLMERVETSRLMQFAQTIVRYVAEKPKANEKRLEEFRDSNLQSLEFALYSPAPIYPSLEKLRLGQSFQSMTDGLGAEDAFVKKVLAGKTAQQRADELVGGTRLADVSFRKSFVEGGSRTVEDSTDPMVVFARQTDPDLRDLRKWREDNVESVEKTSGASVARAFFAVRGKTTYPDATFTLRLAYGPVKGYTENGRPIPYQTTFSGMFAHAEEHGGQAPFDLPERLLKARARIDSGAPVNFVTTADVTGGNSGSPVLNTKGELVGLVFDGNIQTLGNDFVYTDEQARTVGVHPMAIITLLRSVYEAVSIADELEGKHP